MENMLIAKWSDLIRETENQLKIYKGNSDHSYDEKCIIETWEHFLLNQKSSLENYVHFLQNGRDDW
jgi:hypothetical protein